MIRSYVMSSLYRGANTGPAVSTTGLYTDTTQSTSTITGALIVSGGVGIAKNLYVGGVLNVAGLITSTSGISGGPASFTTGAFSSLVTTTRAFNNFFASYASTGTVITGGWYLGSNTIDGVHMIVTSNHGFGIGVNNGAPSFYITNAGNTVNLGNLTVGASTFVVTAATGAVSAGQTVSIGANTSHAADALLNMYGGNTAGLTQIDMYGLASAPGELRARIEGSKNGALGGNLKFYTASAGGAITQALGIDAAQAATFSSSLAITGALTGVTTATLSSTLTVNGATNAQFLASDFYNTTSGTAGHLSSQWTAGTAITRLHTFTQGFTPSAPYKASQTMLLSVNGELAMYAAAGAFVVYAGGTTANFTVANGGAITITTPPAFVAGDKYLVIDASGNIHVSALGPAS